MTYTVFNCGTGYHRNSGDVIANLYAATDSTSSYINDGPGSTERTLIGKARGGLAGKGVDKNVSNAVAAIKEQNARGGLVVNMIGWSRGAITCFKIAKTLFDDQSPEATNLRINIFAIDPVPGGTRVNSHMWKGIDVMPNVKFCEVIFAQHDHRSLFMTPYVPDPWFADIDIMPGYHADLVEAGKRNHITHQLVAHMACEFLETHGTVFNENRFRLSPAEILHNYALIHETYNSYAKNPKTRRRFKKLRPFAKSFRPLHSEDKKRQFKLNPNKPRLFINHHHRTVFTNRFPRVADAIDKASRGQEANLEDPRMDQEFASLCQPQHAKTLDLVCDYLELPTE